MNNAQVERHLSNAVELHPGYGTWKNYLEDYTKLIAEQSDHRLYGIGDYFYVVCPDGFIITARGFNAAHIFSERTGMPVIEIARILS